MIDRHCDDCRDCGECPPRLPVVQPDIATVNFDHAAGKFVPLRPPKGAAVKCKCGEAPERHEKYGFGNVIYAMACPACQVYPATWAESESDAVDRWNKGVK